MFGVVPVSSKPTISRRIIMSAVRVTYTPGDGYSLGSSVDYLILYEFDRDFLEYMKDTEFESEITLSRSMKKELSTCLDNLLGDLTVYWNL